MVLFSLKISKNAAVLNPRVDAGIDPYEVLDIGNVPTSIRQIFNGRTRNETYLFIVRSGNPILRPPEGRSVYGKCNGNTHNGTTCFSARKRYFASCASFLHTFFWQDRKKYARGATVAVAQ